MFGYFLLLLTAYLIGSIPWTSWLLSAWGYEGPEEGPVGPWQALYYGGPLTALLSLWGEAAKGAAAVLLSGNREMDVYSLVLLLAVLLGQQWSPWRRWRGVGGALAVTGGLLILSLPMAQGILTVYTAAMLITRNRRWSAMAVTLSLLPLAAFFHPAAETVVAVSLLMLPILVEQKRPPKAGGATKQWPENPFWLDGSASR